MHDIFVSYKSSDRERVRPLVELFERQGWSVWWDQEIPAGKTFDEFIEEKIAAARCVVVVWSAASVKSNWVRTEAAEGLRREILVPVLIEDVKVPLAFRQIQAQRLNHRSPAQVTEALTQLLPAVAAVINKPQKGVEQELAEALWKALRRRPGLGRLILAGAAVALAFVALGYIFPRPPENGNNANQNANLAAPPTATPTPAARARARVVGGDQVELDYDRKKQTLRFHLPVTFQHEGVIVQMDASLTSTPGKPGDADDPPAVEGFEPALIVGPDGAGRNARTLPRRPRITSEMSELTYSLFFPADESLRRHLGQDRQQRLGVRFRWEDDVTDVVDICFTVDALEDASGRVPLTGETCQK